MASRRSVSPSVRLASLVVESDALGIDLFCLDIYGAGSFSCAGGSLGGSGDNALTGLNSYNLTSLIDSNNVLVA